MAKPRTFISGLGISLFDGADQDFGLVIEYEFHPGFKGSWDEPPEAATAEITALHLSRYGKHFPIPAWLSDWIEADADLLDNLVAHARQQNDSDLADAEERRAEAARDNRMMEGL